MARLKKTEKEYIKRVLLRETHRDAAHMVEARSNAKNAAGDREYWQHMRDIYRANIAYTYEIIKKLEA